MIRRIGLLTLAVAVLATPAAVRSGEPSSQPKVGEPAPGAARRDSDFRAEVTWDKDLATVTWTELLGGSKGFSVLTGPYVGWLTEAEAVIGWEVIAEPKLSTEPYASLQAEYPMEKIKLRWAKLAGLKPDTVYRYKVSSGGYASGERSFRTLPAADAKQLRFLVIGDTQRAGSSHKELDEKLFALMAAEKAPLVLHLGDVVYGGAGYNSAGRKSWYRTLHMLDAVRSSAFMAPALGNHDLEADRYPWPADYFGDIPAGRANAGGEAQPPYYCSFDASGVHFVALCTEPRKADKSGDLSDRQVFGSFSYNQQLKWLDADLAASKAGWNVVFTHQPLHTVGGLQASSDWCRDLGAILDRHKVPLLLSAHDHSYQRTWRIENATRKRSDSGTVQVISGGAANFFDGKSAAWNICYQKIDHYMRMAVDGEAVTFEAVDADGKVFDRWRLKKTGQPEDLPAVEGSGNQRKESR